MKFKISMLLIVSLVVLNSNTASACMPQSGTFVKEFCSTPQSGATTAIVKAKQACFGRIARVEGDFIHILATDGSKTAYEVVSEKRLGVGETLISARYYGKVGSNEVVSKSRTRPAFTLLLTRTPEHTYGESLKGRLLANLSVNVFNFVAVPQKKTRGCSPQGD